MQSVWGGVRIPSRSTRTPWACRRRDVAGLPVRRFSHWLGLGSGVASIKLRFSSLMLAWCFNTSSWVLSKSLSKRQAGEDKGTTKNQHISHGESWTTLRVEPHCSSDAPQQTTMLRAGVLSTVQRPSGSLTRERLQKGVHISCALMMFGSRPLGSSLDLDQSCQVLEHLSITNDVQRYCFSSNLTQKKMRLWGTEIHTGNEVKMKNEWVWHHYKPNLVHLEFVSMSPNISPEQISEPLKQTPHKLCLSQISFEMKSHIRSPIHSSVLMV